MAPRDLVVLRLTGRGLTDTTLASRTGMWTVEGSVYEPAAARWRHLLPDVAASVSIAGSLGKWAADQVHLAAGTPVVVGAGDRQCEVQGTGAAPDLPMVSWGTTANLSVPALTVPEPIPPGLSLSAGAVAGHVLEAGVSASGAALAWLAGVTGRDVAALIDDAAITPPGARGVVALPWLHGARAPWWRRDAGAAFLHVTSAHGTGDLARAIVEGVAFDLVRCLDVVGSASPPSAIMAAGGGTDARVWLDVLAATAALPVDVRLTSEAASAGACLLAADATHTEAALDDINPVARRVEPEPRLVEQYRDLRHRHATAVAAVLSMESEEEAPLWT